MKKGTLLLIAAICCQVIAQEPTSPARSREAPCNQACIVPYSSVGSCVDCGPTHRPPFPPVTIKIACGPQLSVSAISVQSGSTIEWIPDETPPVGKMAVWKNNRLIFTFAKGKNPCASKTINTTIPVCTINGASGEYAYTVQFRGCPRRATGTITVE